MGLQIGKRMPCSCRQHDQAASVIKWQACTSSVDRVVTGREDVVVAWARCLGQRVVVRQVWVIARGRTWWNRWHTGQAASWSHRDAMRASATLATATTKTPDAGSFVRHADKARDGQFVEAVPRYSPSRTTTPLLDRTSCLRRAATAQVSKASYSGIPGWNVWPAWPARPPPLVASSAEIRVDAVRSPSQLDDDKGRVPLAQVLEGAAQNRRSAAFRLGCELLPRRQALEGPLAAFGQRVGSDEKGKNEPHGRTILPQ